MPPVIIAAAYAVAIGTTAAWISAAITALTPSLNYRRGRACPLAASQEKQQ
ncbi:hypothetical protein [Roseateles sp. LKC17W]|uniref:Uncharacterized protein n=1 Tax=Pelomonas margarita TaxID=3299031 RepID=A0ABW7FMS0_9BURK